MATQLKSSVMIIGIDNSDHSFYALDWILDRFFVPFAPNFPFKLVIIHARSAPIVVLGAGGPGSSDIISLVDADLRRTAYSVVEKAKLLCTTKSVNDITVEVVEGDARNVMCDVVERYHASILVLGSHGYGTLKRAVLGSVSDYCAHHAHCSVMIVKIPKHHKH